MAKIAGSMKSYQWRMKIMAKVMAANVNGVIRRNAMAIGESVISQ